MTDIHGVGQDGMLTVQTGVTYDQLKRAQARAEDCGIHGEALREVLTMLCGRMLSQGGSS
jgi:hypothetical protein